MDWENFLAADAFAEKPEDPGKLVAEAREGMEDLNSLIGAPGEAAVDFVNNELGELELFESAVETPPEPADGLTPGQERSEPSDEEEPIPPGETWDTRRFETPITSLNRVNSLSRNGVPSLSQTLQQLMSDAQNANAMTSNTAQKTEDARNSASRNW